MEGDLDPIALTAALVRCRSVTPDEGGALALLEGVLAAAGFQCHRLPFSEAGTPDVDNLYARLGSGSPHLCFAGHTDVVPAGDKAAWTHPPFGAEIHDGILFGRGTADMKGAIGCFIAATMRQLEAHGAPAGSISFLITGDEEGPAINGTAKVLDWMRESGEKMDGCLVGEPTNPKALGDEIKIGRRGSLNGALTVFGKQGHSAYPDLAENPVPKLARMIDALSSAPLDDGTDHFGPSSCQVTVIDAPNTATNVIPARAGAKFNIRYNDSWTKSALKNWVRGICDRVAVESDARYEVAFSGTGDVFLTEPGRLAESMGAAVAAVTGRKPALTTGGGTSDARFIHELCPVIEFGLVNATIHSVDECVPLADLEALTTIYERFIAAYFGAVS